MSRKERELKHVSLDEAVLSFFKQDRSKIKLDFGNEISITFREIEELSQKHNLKIDQQIQNKLNQK